MNHNTFFSVLFTLFITLFTLSACDDGGGENNNNLTVDQDVKDWCAETLYCTEEGRGYDYIPYETQEDCEQIMQWVKNHRNDWDYYAMCLDDTLYNYPIRCDVIGHSWDTGDCSRTPFVCDTNCPGEK